MPRICGIGNSGRLWANARTLHTQHTHDGTHSQKHAADRADAMLMVMPPRRDRRCRDSVAEPSHKTSCTQDTQPMLECEVDPTMHRRIKIHARTQYIATTHTHTSRTHALAPRGVPVRVRCPSAGAVEPSRAKPSQRSKAVQSRSTAAQHGMAHGNGEAKGTGSDPQRSRRATPDTCDGHGGGLWRPS